MFEVIKGRYGKNLRTFKLDYFGKHPDLDAILMNADITFFDKGLQIHSEGSFEDLFIDWKDIKAVSCTTCSRQLISIKTNEDVLIKLKKELKETNISQFTKLLATVVPHIQIEYVEPELDNLSSLDSKRAEKLYELLEDRVEEFIKNCGTDDESEIVNAWCEYLKNNLQFPFQAEIIDDPGCFEIGQVLKVIEIDDVYDLYGIVVNAKIGRSSYSFPLCTLELIDKSSKNYYMVEDYNFWFCNL